MLGSEQADDPDTYRQAGGLLALLHAQTGVPDDEIEDRENRRALAWLDSAHRIAADVERRLRALIAELADPRRRGEHH